MSYICPICGNSHDTTGCPTPRLMRRAGGSGDGNCIQLLPEQYQRALAAAEQRGYERALDMAIYEAKNSLCLLSVEQLEVMKSEYLKEQEGKNDQNNPKD